MKTARACDFVALGASLLLSAATTAHAAHPFVTDDAGTQGKENWQLELLAEQTKVSANADLGAGAVRRESRELVFAPVLTFGLRDNLDIALGGTRLRTRTAEEGMPADEASGPGDSSLELKWRFFESGDLSFALKPGLSLPTGDEDKGLGSGRVSWGSTLILAYETDPWTVLANVAYQRARFALPSERDANRANVWRVSAGVEYELVEEFRLVGEAGVRSNPAKDDPFERAATFRFAMLGFIFSPSEDVDFDLGIRRRVNGAEPDTALLAGATFRW
jgi:hypothetical protein